MSCPTSRIYTYTHTHTHTHRTHLHFPTTCWVWNENQNKSWVRSMIRAFVTGFSPPMPCVDSHSALLQASQQSIISHLISPNTPASCRLQVSYHCLLMKDCSASCHCLSHCHVVVVFLFRLYYSLFFTLFSLLSLSLPPAFWLLS